MSISIKGIDQKKQKHYECELRMSQEQDIVFLYINDYCILQIDYLGAIFIFNDRIKDELVTQKGYPHSYLKDDV